jgi:preprotein translocase subunit SecG
MQAVSTVLLVVHVMIAVALVGVVLMQRSEGGGLGMGGRTDAFMSVRGQANLLTRSTAILATLFFVTSIALALLGGTHSKRGGGFMPQTLPPGQSARAPPGPQPGTQPGGTAPGAGSPTPGTPQAPTR